jgi:alkylated DNA repair dioxygenase AlkB
MKTVGGKSSKMNAILVQSFLAPSQAQALFVCLQSLPWTRGKFMGSAVPRQEVWIGPYAYKFSGRTLEAHAWTPEVEAIRDRIQARYGGNYNSVLLNRYANERDSVSWHSDDEPEMDSEHPIASLSLGASRTFLIRAIANKKAIETYVLTSGSLLVMPPGFQQRYQHSVPKSKVPCGPRINLTLRRMKVG